jgi:hypothetical protein
MEYHLERRVVLDENPKHKNIYKWTVREVADAAGRPVADQIPWSWSVYFTLADTELQVGIRFDPYRFENRADAKVETTRIIRAKLRSGDRDGDDRVRFSMFGTSREIDDFTLRIQETPAGEQEHCRAGGVVSYTTEHDFRDRTHSDCVGLDIYVTADRFAAIEELLKLNALGGGVLRVSGVSGFYSDWSPMITTRNVKVLTGDEQSHPVEIPANCNITPPRLGEVGEFDLTLRTASTAPAYHPPAGEGGGVRAYGETSMTVGASPLGLNTSAQIQQVGAVDRGGAPRSAGVEVALTGWEPPARDQSETTMLRPDGRR